MSSPAYSYKVLSTREEFYSLQESWDELLLNTQHPSFFSSWLWLKTWLECFWQHKQSLFVVLILKDQQLVGAAPFIIHTRHKPLLGPFRELTFLGCGEPEADSVVTEYTDVLARRGEERSVVSQLLAVLKGHSKCWDKASFPHILVNSVFKTQFQGELESLAYSADEQVVGFRYGVSLETVEGDSSEQTWEKYLVSLEPKFRKKMLYKQRKVQRQGELVYRVVDTVDQLAPAIAALKSLHAKRWQSVGKTGVFTSEKFQAFHGQLMKQCLLQGSLVMQVLELDQQIIAVLYNFRFAGLNYYYQSGIDMQTGKNISVGVAAHCAAIKSSIESGDSFYDFMCGNAQSYKNDYSNIKTPMVHLYLYNRSLKGCLLALESLSKSVLRKLKAIFKKA